MYSTYSKYNLNCASPCPSLALSMTQFLNSSGTLESWLETNFWNQYPACANINCLSLLTAESGCDLSNNRCLCLNGTLLTTMAECIENACSTSTVSDVYTLYEAACSENGGYIIALDSAQWETAARSGSVSGSSPSPLPGTSSSSQVATGGPLRTVSASGTYSLPSTSLPTSIYSSTSSASGIYSLLSTSLATSTYSSPSSSLTSQTSAPTCTTSSRRDDTEGQKISLGVGLTTIILATLGFIREYLVRRRRGY